MIKITFTITVFLILVIPAYASNHIVNIPFGAHDPNLNTPAEHWYDPPVKRISVGDTVKWINNDREAHTVTSGEGTGRFGWMGGEKFGEPTDEFDSGLFKQGDSFSYTFEEKGLFRYFCTVHPWMEGVVFVGEQLPSYPHDAEGNRHEEFPIIKFTPDELIELDLSWAPKVIKTNEKVQFIYQTYDPSSNTNLDRMKYDLILIQNGKEIFQDKGVTTVGGDFKNYVFEEPGQIKIRFENIVSSGTSGITSPARQPPSDPSARTIEFSAMVYENPDDTASEALQDVKVQSAQRLELQYEILVLIIVVPGALAIIAILKMMYGKDKRQKSSSAV